jgi:hypothetical protein
VGENSTGAPNGCGFSPPAQPRRPNSLPDYRCRFAIVRKGSFFSILPRSAVVRVMCSVASGDANSLLKDTWENDSVFATKAKDGIPGPSPKRQASEELTIRKTLSLEAFWPAGAAHVPRGGQGHHREGGAGANAEALAHCRGGKGSR